MQITATPGTQQTSNPPTVVQQASQLIRSAGNASTAMAALQTAAADSNVGPATQPTGIGTCTNCLG